MSPQIRLLARDSACSGHGAASARRRARTVTPRLTAESPVDPYAGAIVLAAAYYAYCVYGKSTRKDKETEPLMPVATATPMT